MKTKNRLIFKTTLKNCFKTLHRENARNRKNYVRPLKDEISNKKSSLQPAQELCEQVLRCIKSSQKLLGQKG